MTDAPSREALSRYGLAHPPFGHDVGLDDLFYYPHLQQCLELLIQLAEYSDRLILVSGPDGAGKTSLLRLFLDQARDHWHRCVYQGSEQIHADELFAAIADCIDPENDAQVGAEELPQLLQAVHLAGRRPLLIIDDADRLPQETLRALTAFARAHAADGPLLPMVLFTRPGLSLRIGQSNTLDIQELALPTMELDEARVFLNHRMQIAGSQTAFPIPDEAFEALHEEANGYPGGLLALSHQALFDSAVPARTSSVAVEAPESGSEPPRTRESLAGPRPPWAKIAAVAVLVLLLGGALIYQDTINRYLGGGEEAGPVTPATPAKASETPSQEDAGWAVAKDTPVPSPKSPTAPEKVVEWHAPPEPPELSAPPKDEGPSWSEAPAGTVEIEPLVESETSPEPLPAPIQHGDTRPPLVTDSTDAAPEPPPLQTLAAAEEPVPTPTPKPKPVQKAEPPSQPRTQSRPAIEASRTISGVRGEDWLRQRDPKRWTLQILAVGEEAALREFVTAKGLSGKVSYYRSERKGKPWYSLLYGEFESREAALKGASQLPRLGTSPWPRSFSSVQSNLR